MWQVRYALHMITDREEDRLLFDHQRELAALWGLEDGDKLAVEQFMQVYYRWALALGQLNEVLIQNFDQAILRQNREDDIASSMSGSRCAMATSRHAIAIFSAAPPGTAGSVPAVRHARGNQRHSRPHHSPDSRSPAPGRRHLPGRRANKQTFLEILRSPTR